VKNKQDEVVNANNRETEEPNEDDQQQKDDEKREEDFKLINLALDWNYMDGVLPILQSRQEAIADLLSWHNTLNEKKKRQEAMRKQDAEYNKVRLYLLKVVSCRLIIIERDGMLQTII